MRARYKAWTLPYLKDNPDIAYSSLDKKDKLLKPSFSLEIGGGKGDFIVGQALKFPKRNFIMIERVTSVAGPAVKKIKENNINNVHVIYDNFVNVSHDLKKNSVDIIYLNFSDPWPKARHAKRRLTSPLFMKDYHRILKKNGEIRFKTDQKNLYEYTKLVLNKKEFEIKLDNPNYQILDNDDSMTEYESKFRNKGNTIYRLVLKKI